MVLLLVKKTTLLIKIQAMSAHESERVSCPSQLSLQTLVHNERSSRLRFLFPKYTSAIYEGILSVCLIWGSGLEAV